MKIHAAKRLALTSITLIALTFTNLLAAGSELDARSIIMQATKAAGGDSWRYARSNLMKGNAMLYRGGTGVYADLYEMRRVYPETLPQAHTNTGKFRLDAYTKNRAMFTISYDGERMYNQSGPMPENQAEELAASSFGFSAVRFALDEAFSLKKMPDDQVEGRPAYFVQITDPAGGNTLVGVDKENYMWRFVGWQTPRGWHHRLYSNHYTLDSGFVQPGRVRLFYDGIKEADINWTSASLNIDLPDDLFRIPPAQ